MGRFTKAYSPDPLVFTERVSDVCSSTTVTVTLGITPPDESVTSPVMPPRVCCARTVPEHSATAAAKASSRGIGEETIRMKCLTLHSLENRDFPSGLGGGDRETLGSNKDPGELGSFPNWVNPKQREKVSTAASGSR